MLEPASAPQRVYDNHCLVLAGLLVGQLKNLLDRDIEKAGYLQGDDGGRYEAPDLNGAYRFTRHTDFPGKVALAHTMLGAEHPYTIVQGTAHTGSSV